MLTAMTINASAASSTPLLTDRDKVTRIRDLLAPATNPSQLWIMILDADGYQTPILIPLDERPTFPEPSLIDGLISALSTVIDDQTDGRGEIMFVLERFGPFGSTADDHCWAAALAGACARAGIGHAGTFLLSRGGVAPVEI